MGGLNCALGPLEPQELSAGHPAPLWPQLPPQGQPPAHTGVCSASEPQSGFFILQGLKTIKREHFMT